MNDRPRPGQAIRTLLNLAIRLDHDRRFIVSMSLDQFSTTSRDDQLVWIYNVRRYSEIREAEGREVTLLLIGVSRRWLSHGGVSES